MNQKTLRNIEAAYERQGVHIELEHLGNGFGQLGSVCELRLKFFGFGHRPMAKRYQFDESISAVIPINVGLVLDRINSMIRSRGICDRNEFPYGYAFRSVGIEDLYEITERHPTPGERVDAYKVEVEGDVDYTDYKHVCDYIDAVYDSMIMRVWKSMNQPAGLTKEKLQDAFTI